MATLAELRTQLQAVSEELHSHYQAAEAACAEENRDGWSDAEKQRNTELTRKHDDLQERIKIAAKIEIADKQQQIESDANEREEREGHEAVRQYDDPNADPNRPITDWERTQALIGWAGYKSGKTTREQQLAMERCGFNPLATEMTIHFNPGKDENNVTQSYPRSLREAEKQSAERRERRGRELADWQANYRLGETRQQATDPDTAGGYTVPESAMQAIDVALLAFGGMRIAGDVMRTATGSRQPWPTTNDTTTKAQIVDENAAIPLEDIVFGQMVLTAFKYASHVKVSWELMQDSSVNIPALVGRLLGERIGRGTNEHFTTGAGTTEPTGIVTAATDSTITTASNTAITWAELLQLKHSVDPAYRPGAAWMMNDALLLQMKQIQDTQGRPLWGPSLEAGEPGTFDGDPIIINQDMPTGSAAKAVLYGQLMKYKIRDVMPMTFRRLDELFAINGQVGFLVWSRHDGNLLDAGTNPVKFLTLAT